MVSATAVRPAALSQRDRSCFKIIKITLVCPGSKTLILNYRDGTAPYDGGLHTAIPKALAPIEAINGTALTVREIGPGTVITVHKYQKKKRGWYRGEKLGEERLYFQRE